MILFKLIKNRILIISAALILSGLTLGWLYRRQHFQNRLNLPCRTAAVGEFRIRLADTDFRLFRRNDVWMLAHPAYPQAVEADVRAVETLLNDLQHWEVEALCRETDIPDGVSPAREGRLSVYVPRRWGGNRKVWDRRFVTAADGLYLREGGRLYSRLYDPRQADSNGRAALATDLSAEARFWRNKWICHYFYYEIAAAEWQSADAHYRYTAETARQPQATAAFRAVYFDRYATAADSATLTWALAEPAAARFSVISTHGDSTSLTVYPLRTADGQPDWFQTCGLLDRGRRGQTPAAPPDTVFLSHLLLDRLKSALSAFPADSL